MVLWGFVGDQLVILTVNQQLCAVTDHLMRHGIVELAAINSLRAGLNIFYPEVQPGRRS